MSKSKLEKMIKISDLIGSDEIEIRTHSFKVRGTLVKDREKIIEDVISIKAPVITQLLGHIDEPDTAHGWINIFDDQVVAFTLIKK